MNAHYSLDIDQAHHVVRIKLGGLFRATDVACFADQLARAYRHLPPRQGRHLTLCDVTDCRIQLQEVVDGFRTLLKNPQLMSRRIAFVTGASPAKMQIRRLIDRDTARAFDTADAAEQWLLAD